MQTLRHYLGQTGVDGNLRARPVIIRPDARKRLGVSDERGIATLYDGDPEPSMGQEFIARDLFCGGLRVGGRTVCEGWCPVAAWLIAHPEAPIDWVIEVAS